MFTYLVVCVTQLESMEDKMQHQMSEQDKLWRKKLDQVVRQHKNHILKVISVFQHNSCADDLRIVLIV